MNYRKKHIKPKIRNLKPKKSIFKMRFFWFAILIILLLTTVAYFILFSSRFNVSIIEILGNEKIKNNDIKSIVMIESGSRIFLVNKNKLAKKLLAEFPIIEMVTIKKRMPNKVILNIKERQPFAIFCQDEKICFFIDKNGVIFESTQNNQQSIIIHKESNDKEIFLGENVVNKNIIDIIYKVQKNLKDNFQIDVKEILVSDTLVFTTAENWQIYFDPNSDIDLAITKMNILLKDEIPANTRKNLQYLYLQYKDRVYYK